MRPNSNHKFYEKFSGFIVKYSASFLFQHCFDIFLQPGPDPLHHPFMTDFIGVEFLTSSVFLYIIIISGHNYNTYTTDLKIRKTVKFRFIT